VATSVGSTASALGGGLLIATGAYTVLRARVASDDLPVPTGPGRLVVMGAALSIDNLVVGFALGTHKVPIMVAAVVIAVVSVAMTLVGLELGKRLGASVERGSAELGGVVLVVVGIAIASGIL